MSVAIKHFDALGYVKEAKKLGASEELAELQARQIEQAIEIAVATVKDEITLKDLATKKDIEVSKNQIILWVVGIMAANSIFFLGILAKGFHWF